MCKLNPSKLKPPIRLVPITKKATPNPAPEVIPSTDGPAIGFLNKVCISKPTSDKPAPVIIAVMDFGIRKLKRMCSQVSLDKSLPNNPFAISLSGIATEPKLMLSIQKKTKANSSNKK